MVQEKNQCLWLLRCGKHEKEPAATQEKQWKTHEPRRKRAAQQQCYPLCHDGLQVLHKKSGGQWKDHGLWGQADQNPRLPVIYGGK